MEYSMEHCCYRELCSDPALHPYGSGAELIADTVITFKEWQTTTAPVLNQDQLMFNVEFLHVGRLMTGGVGVFVTTPDNLGGTLQIFHGFSGRFRRPYRGVVFAYQGDVKGLDIKTVEFSTDAFALTGEVRVAQTLDYHMDQYTNNPGLELVPCWNEGADHTRMIKTRKSMYVPFSLIPYVIGKNLSARDALHVLIPVIREQGMEGVYAPLIDFLIAATTNTNDGAPITEQATAGVALVGDPDSDIVRTRRKALLFFQLPKLEFTINEGDNHCYKEIMSNSGIQGAGLLPEERNSTVAKMFSIMEIDGERRITHLNLPRIFAGALPSSIGTMTSLIFLSLYNSGITSLPRSIGLLKNLEELDLSNTFHLINLPEEIGDLVGLKKIYLDTPAIKLLPRSIGRLRNLECQWLGNLPEDIGDFASLNKLRVINTDIITLPPSIGRLTNLKDLNLSSMYHFKSLPEQIGDLDSLNTLDLNSSGIRSLPSSIGRLKNLKDLILYGTRRLVNLPETIGDLVSLNKLDLKRSCIASLPSSIGRLENLNYLRLSHTKKLTNLPEEILNLANLGCSLSIHMDIKDNALSECRVAKKLLYTMALNIARSRTGYVTTDEDSVRITPILWPLVLNNATRAFENSLYFPDIQMPDAMYQLIVDFRGSFIDVLLNRKQINVRSGT